MKVRIDADNCTSCGICVDSVPDVFQMGDETAEVIMTTVPAKLMDSVNEAADDCPAEAIIISE